MAMGDTGEKKAAMPGDVKMINRRRVLQVLRAGRVVTAADVHKETGISRPTVMRTLQDFCRQGVACSLGLGESTLAGGKKPELFCFSEKRKILCINLWPREINLGICGMIGDMDEIASFPMPEKLSLDAAFSLLARKAQAYMDQLQLALGQLYGVMLSVSGTVEEEKGILRHNVKAPEWGVNVALLPRLQAIFGNDVEYFITNAGKAAGRGALMDRPAYAGQRVMTLFTTWGICACLVERGHVLNGRDSLIGEIGHMVISDQADSYCTCGKKGCLESLVSLARVKEMLRGWGEEEGWLESLTLPRLFDFSARGHENARRAVRYLAHCFAVALHNLSLSYNQEAVIIQGDFAWADALFDQCIREELAQFCYYPDHAPFEMIYDRRDLKLASLQGGAQVIRKKYFSLVD